jgi:putative acetyltransferase
MSPASQKEIPLTGGRMPDTIKIRSAHAEDAIVLAPAERTIAETPGFLVSKPHELIDENFEEKISELESCVNGKYLVAEIGNTIVAHGMLNPLPLDALGHVVQLTLVVHKGWQGKGVGKALLSALLEWAKSEPTVEKIELCVRSSNFVAQDLYKKMGFTEEGRWRKRIKIGERKYLDDVLMGLWVGDANQGDRI